MSGEGVVCVLPVSVQAARTRVSNIPQAVNKKDFRQKFSLCMPYLHPPAVPSQIAKVVYQKRAARDAARQRWIEIGEAHSRRS